jgi:hypothetical protein
VYDVLRRGSDACDLLRVWRSCDNGGVIALLLVMQQTSGRHDTMLFVRNNLTLVEPLWVSGVAEGPMILFVEPNHRDGPDPSSRTVPQFSEEYTPVTSVQLAVMLDSRDGTSQLLGRRVFRIANYGRLSVQVRRPQVSHVAHARVLGVNVCARCAVCRSCTVCSWMAWLRVLRTALRSCRRCAPRRRTLPRSAWSCPTPSR